jgi:glyoxylase-like metal-dependent hydrolase (beta-lactamase superfamily II)
MPCTAQGVNRAVAMKIIPLSEGSFTIDATKKFIPFDPGSDNLQHRPAGSLLVEIQPFAVITEQDIIVIDTGLGYKNEKGELQIHRNLADNGINPAEVTKVLVSHLHKDHAGGIGTTDDVLKKQFFSFPMATYYVNRDEFDFGIRKGSPSYHPEDFELLSGSGNVAWLQGDGTIEGTITYQVSGAHCPFHQVFWIEEGGQKLFFGGDVAPQLQQMKSRFIAKYDYDGRRCMELRQQGKEEGWTFLFYHDIKTPVVGFE